VPQLRSGRLASLPAKIHGGTVPAPGLHALLENKTIHPHYGSGSPFAQFVLLLMNNEIKRDLGEQPMAKIMAEHGLKPNDLVSSSTEQITHKMVSRAVKGRRLNLKIQYRILNALNKASGKQYVLKDLFDY